MIKKSNFSNSRITPLHLACINPDGRYLKELLTYLPKYTLDDSKGYSLLHYAAACSSSEPLEILAKKTEKGIIKAGSITPLIVACKNGRVHNLKYLVPPIPKIEDLSEETFDDEKAKIKRFKGFLKEWRNDVNRIYQGLPAIHHAAVNGDIEVIKELLNLDVPMDTVTPEKESLLCVASASGHLDLVKFLVQGYKDQFANIEHKNKYHQTPAIHAAMNGQLHVLSYLHHMGANLKAQDSSGNTILHYAAAFGWLETVKYLVEKGGASPLTLNDWKDSVVAIAMLKGHLGIAKYLFAQNGVDINVRNDDGKTYALLEIHSGSFSLIPSLVEMGIDLNIPDLLGNTPLISALTSFPKKGIQKKEYLELLTLLLNKNVNLDSKNTNGVNAISITISRVLPKLFFWLKKNGATVTYENHLNFFKSYFEYYTRKNKISKLLEIFKDASEDPEFLRAVASFGVLSQLKYPVVLETQDKRNDFISFRNIKISATIAGCVKQALNQHNERYSNPLPDVSIYLRLFEFLIAHGAVSFEESPILVVIEKSITLQSGEYNLNINEHNLQDSEEVKINDNMVLDVQPQSPKKKMYPICSDSDEYDSEMEMESDEDEIAKPSIPVNNIVAVSYTVYTTNNSTIIHDLATHPKATEFMNQLLKISAKSLFIQANAGYTPLSIAISKNILANVQLFLSYNASVDVKLSDSHNLLNLAIISNNIHIFNEVISRNPSIADCEYAIDEKKEKTTTIFHNAISRSVSQDILIELFSKLHFDPKLTNYRRQTLLHQLTLDYPLNQAAPIVSLLISKGVNINATDASNSTVLHYAIKNATTAYIQLLINNGANPNVQDYLGLTPLHYAIERISKTDDSFDIGEILLNANANVNTLDNFNRGPIHYAFVNTSPEIKSFQFLYNPPKNKTIMEAFIENEKKFMFNSVSQKDPIETITSFCTAGADATIVDIFGRLPLHYAAFCGSIICALYILNPTRLPEGSIEAVDKDANTPLNISLIGKNRDFALVLLQKQTNTSQKIAIPSFNVKTFENGDQVMDVTYNYVSVFSVLIKNGWQGLAYMILDQGFDYLIALGDTLTQGKFQLAVTLINKTKDNATVCRTNELGNNLLHIFAKSDAVINDEWSETIVKKLIFRGIPYDALNLNGNSILHVTAFRGQPRLCNYLTRNYPQLIHLQNNNKKTAFEVAFKHGLGSEISKILIQSGSNINITLPLKDQEYSTPFIISTYHVQNLELSKLLYSYKADIEMKDSYQCNAFTRLVHDNKLNKNLIDWLFSIRISVNVPYPENGRTPLMYAIRNNNTYLFDNILNKHPDISIADNDGNTVFHHVVNPVEYGSYENATFLRALLNLPNAREILKQKNDDGRTPIMNAMLQESGKLIEVFRSFGYEIPLKPDLSRVSSVISNWADQEYNHEFDADELLKSASSDLVEIIPQADHRGKAADANATLCFEKVKGQTIYYTILLSKVEVGLIGTVGVNNFYKMQILRNPVKDLYFLLTIWGRFGESGQFQRTPFPSFNDAIDEFCKIFKSKTGNAFDRKSPNATYPKQADKYKVVQLERYERNYHNLLQPFSDIECNLPSKLSVETKSVVKVLTNISTVQQAYKAHGINTKRSPLGQLSTRVIDEAIEVLRKIKTILDNMENIKKNNIEVDENADKDEKEEKDEAKDEPSPFEQIVELTNHFYELIPHENYVNEKIVPIQTKHEVNEKIVKMLKLKEMELCAKILLGARHRIKEINPLEYCYRIMNINLQKLNKPAENRILKQYFQNTSDSHGNNVTAKFFELQRKEEPGVFNKWKDMKNHFLLWHGTSPENMISIMATGLRIAPPEAPTSGWLFGKGVYFADMFQKAKNYTPLPSWPYAHKIKERLTPEQWENRPRAYLLLCEVALGQMCPFITPTYMESPAEGYDSTKAIGMKGPDFTNSLTLPNGVIVPTGPVIETSKGVIRRAFENLENVEKNIYNTRERAHMPVNEYIVYDTSRVRIRYLVQIEHKLVKPKKKF